jgi:hypothetical protein
MHRATFHNRKAFQIENDLIRVTVTEESGHIAEILNKATGVNPLWTPPWTSIEPSTWSEEKHPEYGGGAEAHLLSAIMGHNLCLYLFGGPSPEEAAAGIRVHGEAGLVPWDFEPTTTGLIARCVLPLSRLAFERTISLDGHKVNFRETVKNLEAFDRPIAWTQHVTLGTPFLERGKTEFYANGGLVGALPDEKDQMKTGYVLDKVGAGLKETLSSELSSGGFRSFLMDKSQPTSHFIAWSPALETALAYVWKRSDFPWIGVWDENCYRETKPWSQRTLARGLEFSASPFPEARKSMIDRGRLFDTPAFAWISAKGKLTAEYYATTIKTSSMPASIKEFEK